MTKNLPFPFELNGWPLPPLKGLRAHIRRSRPLSPNDSGKTCIMGSPELAERLLCWLQDAQEDLSLQIWLVRIPGSDKLKLQLCLEVTGEAADAAEEWESDISSLTELCDPGSGWSDEGGPPKDWTDGMLLDIVDSGEDEPEFQHRLVDDLFRLLGRTPHATAVVVSLNFHWSIPKAGAWGRHMPPSVMENPMLRRRWKLFVQRKERRMQIPSRIARRRVAVLSRGPITSLLRQSVFRAVAGEGQICGCWHRMQEKEIGLFADGPLTSFGFMPRQRLDDAVSIEDLRRSLTANLGSYDRLVDTDDIPF
jgi:hypothetical protein